MFEQARLRMPTDAALLSDLGFALLQARQPERARVPLMQAAQLQAEAPDAAPQVFSNLAVYLVLAGREQEARDLMDRRGMAPEVRQAIVRQARALDAAAQGRGAEPGVADAVPEPAPADAVGAALPPAAPPPAAGQASPSPPPQPAR